MREIRRIAVVLLLFLLLPVSTAVYGANQTQFIYDDAGLLTGAEKEALTALAMELGEERNTAFLVLTADGTDGKDIVKYVDDFYDDQKPGYDQPYGNTAILAIDMQTRDIYLAGFKQAEVYLDDARLDKIRDKITPDLSDGNYADAFTGFIMLAHEYMGYEPGFNPDNILFKWWFQLAAAITIAAVSVGLMAYRSGGRVTVGGHTYMNNTNSRVISKYDRYIRKTVTKQKKPSNNSGGGGGGITGGGHSHSGSRGKF